MAIVNAVVRERPNVRTALGHSSGPRAEKGSSLRQGERKGNNKNKKGGHIRSCPVSEESA